MYENVANEEAFVIFASYYKHFRPLSLLGRVVQQYKNTPDQQLRLMIIVWIENSDGCVAMKFIIVGRRCGGVRKSMARLEFKLP